MKNTKWLLRGAALTMALAGTVSLFTACGKDDVVVVEPVEDNVSVVTTNPAHAGKLLFTELMGINSTNMTWSMLSPYKHTDNGDNTATFEVPSSDKTCTLYVEYDPDSDKVKKAELSYGDVKADVLSDDNAVFMPILQAMQEG